MKSINGIFVSGDTFFLMVEWLSLITIIGHLLKAIRAWEVE